MDITLLILILIFGFMLVLVELLVVPGTSVLGIIGFSGMIFGVVRTFLDHGQTAGWITLSSVLLVCTVLIVWFLKTRSWKKITLDDKLEGKVNLIDEQKIKVGDEGKTMSRLAPTGHALFAGEPFEVQSMDGYIDPKTPVTVVKIENNKIFVVGV